MIITRGDVVFSCPQIGGSEANTKESVQPVEDSEEDVERGWRDILADGLFGWEKSKGFIDTTEVQTVLLWVFACRTAPVVGSDGGAAPLFGRSELVSERDSWLQTTLAVKTRIGGGVGGETEDDIEKFKISNEDELKLIFGKPQQLERLPDGVISLGLCRNGRDDDDTVASVVRLLLFGGLLFFGVGFGGLEVKREHNLKEVLSHVGSEVYCTDVAAVKALEFDEKSAPIGTEDGWKCRC